MFLQSYSWSLDGAAAFLKNTSSFFVLLFLFLFFCLSSLIIHLFFLDAKTTTNRTTAQIMYSVKSSLSGGERGTRRRGGGQRKCALEWDKRAPRQGEAQCHSAPWREGRKTNARGEKKEYKYIYIKRERDRKIQFVSHKSPIRGIRVLKWRITMNNLWLQFFLCH